MSTRVFNSTRPEGELSEKYAGGSVELKTLMSTELSLNTHILADKGINEKEKEYRWYACEQTWNGNYKCKRVDGLHGNPIEKRMIPISRNIPSILDPIVLKTKLIPRVKVI